MPQTIELPFEIERQTMRAMFRRGTALVVVLVLVMLMSLAAYRFSFYMESQYRLTRLNEEQAYARAAALSGLELAAAMVQQPREVRLRLGGVQNNSRLFRHIPIQESASGSSERRAAELWYCCLISQQDAATQMEQPRDRENNATSLSAIQFGLENESAKIHLPTLVLWERRFPGHARQALLNLPGVDSSWVDDWLRSLGIASRSTLSANSAPSLGAASVSMDRDQLTSAWYAGDLNQNYRLDPLEQQIQATRTAFAMVRPGKPASSISPESVHGLQRFVTWHSGHRNLNRLGQPKINLNDPDVASLHRQLLTVWPQDWANFVVAMRQFGPTTKNGMSSTNSSLKSDSSRENESNTLRDWSPDLSRPGNYTLRSVLELVGAEISLQGNPTPGTTPMKRSLYNPFSSDMAEIRNYLEKLLDEVSLDSALVREGAIDVSNASVAVLQGVPGIDRSLAERIVQHRSSNMQNVEKYGTIAWLSDILDIQRLQELEPFLTNQSDVYSVQSVGYRDEQSAVYRVTAVIDGRQIPARIQNRKVWHTWDRGFSVDEFAEVSP